MAAFPMQDPNYVIYVLVLQPKPDATTHGFTTGGYVAAPAVGRIIARIGPMLGVQPVAGDTLAALTAALTVPLNPPGGVLGPGHPLPAGANGFAYELAGLPPPPGSLPVAEPAVAKLHAGKVVHAGRRKRPVS